ncbi:glycosyltransferase [Methylobacterium mesophilicum SR1.6/6]|uniref:Glycosyltransferase n=2 Tax=Methylobacterium mesophilicum TaxID=39956 RepID=A0A6B9FUM4_9HYPH|nr:glycosyltransferase [Methylobacterium mesophilicum SR1.6/6]
MEEFSATVCLSMIVRNEAPVIKRCLDSVIPFIDHWIIVDTGSTDGTREKVQAALAGLPGMLVERPWVDFAFNRNEALTLARPHADYSLIIDAAAELIIPDDFVLPNLQDAGYTFQIVKNRIQYRRIQLVSNKLNWCYRGVIHEFLECSGNPETPALPLFMRYGDDGARHRDRVTELRDIAAMEKALSTEADPFLISRYTFYLARSYRDTGQHFKALDHFLRRGEFGFDEEEVYLSLLEAVCIMEKLGAPAETVLKMYDQIIPICPDRAEARYSACRYLRSQGKFATALSYAEAGIALDVPAEGVSIDTSVYKYGMLHELADSVFHLGKYRLCISACLKIMRQADVTPDILQRSITLAREALAKLTDPAWGCQPVPYTSDFMPDWQI